MMIIGKLFLFSFICFNLSFVFNHRFSLYEKRLIKEIKQILVGFMNEVEEDGKMKLNNFR